MPNILFKLDELTSFQNFMEINDPLQPKVKNKWINCTGDVVKGDTIKFEEAVFSGSFRKPKFEGMRTIIANVIKDSYGKDKQQHTFTIEVIESSGVDPLEPGEKITRKGRNIYRNGTERLVWKNEEDRVIVANEKHQRGDIARQARYSRKNMDY
jgi:hypothetical protein